MNEQNEMTYAVVVTISLPGTDSSATASVTLAESDSVPVGQNSKPISECTLADLQQFGDQLQADVWDTYQNIRLLDLDEDETVDVEIAVVESDGGSKPLPETILEQAVVLFTATESAVIETAVTKMDVEEIPIIEMPAPESIPVFEEAVSNSDDVEPQISISEPEMVYEEIENEHEREKSADIVRSRARVRLAGEQLPVGSMTWAAVDIIMEEPALRAAQAHALSSLRREVAGVLIGPPPEKQPDGRYLVHIFDTIVAKHTVMKGASVTYTPESWRYMNDRLREKYPDGSAVMVGWYHTHPGFGIFLSGMDQFIHQNFFTQIWHVAQVLDPVARTSGFFCWDREKTQVKRIDFPWPEWAAGSW